VPGNPPDPRPRSPFVKEASKRGIFAFITDSDVEEWQSAIDIVLRRFAEYQTSRARSAAEWSPSEPRAS
jgi:hypothetical protein